MVWSAAARKFIEDGKGPFPPSVRFKVVPCKPLSRKFNYFREEHYFRPCCPKADPCLFHASEAGMKQAKKKKKKEKADAS